MHVLYRFFDEGDALLYIGITMDPSARFSAHRHTKTWWHEVATISLEHFGSRPELIEAEALAIQRERPLYNVIHNGGAQYRRKVQPVEWDMTDAGVEIALVDCPFCGEEHRHYFEDDLATADCGGGKYWVR